VKTDCGYDLTLVMDFGAIALKLDEQQKIRAISVGYILKTDGEKGQNLVNNAINGLHSIQAVLSLTTTDKLGESEAGKQLRQRIQSDRSNSAKRRSGRWYFI
ncbi:TPA: hypothetical protein ACFOZG_001639, partial [Neisseria meningitidis]